MGAPRLRCSPSGMRRRGYAVRLGCWGGRDPMSLSGGQGRLESGSRRRARPSIGLPRRGCSVSSRPSMLPAQQLLESATGACEFRRLRRALTQLNQDIAKRDWSRIHYMRSAPCSVGASRAWPRSPVVQRPAPGTASVVWAILRAQERSGVCFQDRGSPPAYRREPSLAGSAHRERPA